MTAGAAVSMPIVQVRDVRREFHQSGMVRVALDGVSFDLAHGTTLAVVGESGAGKSTLGRLIAGLDHPTSGTILVDGQPPRITAGAPSAVQMIFQDPRDALNPYLSVGASVREPLLRLGRDEQQRRMRELLERVGLDPRRAGDRPSGFSGGQQQRIVIARALAASPKLLVCDEPTSSLDVSVQAQLVNLLLELQASLGFASLLVTHDLSVVRALADEVLVLRRGVAVEHTPAAQFFEEPRHEYSRSLLRAVALQALSRHEWYESRSKA